MLKRSKAESKAVAGSGLVADLGGYLVAALVWGIGLSLGGATGYAINPARDLGPRIAHALLPMAGEGPSGWSYSDHPGSRTTYRRRLGGNSAASD